MLPGINGLSMYRKPDAKHQKIKATALLAVIEGGSCERDGITDKTEHDLTDSLTDKDNLTASQKILNTAR